MPLMKKMYKQEFEYKDSDNDVWDIVYFETPDRKYIQLKLQQDPIESFKVYEMNMLVELIKQLTDSLNPANFNNLPRPNIVDYRKKATSPKNEDVFSSEASLVELRTGVKVDQVAAEVETVPQEVDAQMQVDIERRNEKKVVPEDMV